MPWDEVRDAQRTVNP